ncbi:MAG TPA: 50S ribosomal protein L13 [Candidatus Saccharimonadales bacterium]|nr:50S ribosomal protein L13 [Candidatus Saccharimonadales bacterium]
MKTFSQKPAEVTRKWVQLDASEAPLGRLATTAAKYLIGKYKPTYTAHIDGGDYVVITNAANLVVTGNKMEDKKYYHHSGFPGGIKERTLAEQLERDPTKIIVDAVAGMLPRNKLHDDRLRRLKVFAGEEHAHTAQTPTKVEVEK